MTPKQFTRLCREQGAIDPPHVAGIGMLAVSRGVDPLVILERIRRNQPALFAPQKPVVKPAMRYGVRLT